MSHKKFPPKFICPQGGCPEPPQVIIKHSTSVKMRQAQMLKKYGFFTPSNKHTANLPGTRRQHIRKSAAELRQPPIWPCGSDPAAVIGGGSGGSAHINGGNSGKLCKLCK